MGYIKPATNFCGIIQWFIARSNSWFKYFFLVYDNSDSSRISGQCLDHNIKSNSGRYYWIRCRSFFIEAILEKNRNKKKALFDHYHTLRDDVLNYWLNQEAKLHSEMDDSPRSLIPLYVKLSKDMGSRLYFNRLRCHLKTAYKKSDHKTLTYKETNDIITDIEQNEPKHNQQVIDFMNGIEQRIRNAIYAKEDCNIENIDEYGSFDESVTPSFIMEHITEYYMAKFAGRDEELDIRQLKSDFQLFMTSDRTEIGRGDEETMKCLKKKLDTLEKGVVKELKQLTNEANRLKEQFNVHLKSKARDLVVQIGGGYLHGKCEFELNLR
jgi:hypothetical protein